MRDRKISEMADEELRELMKKRRGKCHTGEANAAQRELWKRHWHDIPRRPEEKEELPQ